MRTKKLGRKPRADMINEVEKLLKRTPGLTLGQMQTLLIAGGHGKHDRKSISRWKEYVA